MSEEELHAERVEGPAEHVLKAHEENAARHAEAMGWTEESHVEAEERKQDREDALSESQRGDEDNEQNQKHVKQLLKTTTATGRAEHSKEGLHQAQAKKDEFQKPAEQAQEKPKPKLGLGELTSARPLGTETVNAARTTDAVREAAERALKSGKPPDAFTLLNQAEPHGVYFKEDSEREGHSEEQEDPELAAAVEECIRLLFGIRGILRIGPGRNQADEPVIVICVGQGFGEASMRAVPDKVHRFGTLLAMPYDVLPLKKER